MAECNDYLYSTPFSGSLELHSFPPHSSLLTNTDFRKLIAIWKSGLKKSQKAAVSMSMPNQNLEVIYLMKALEN